MIPSRLCDLIGTGRVVTFFGAGASRAAGLPLGDQAADWLFSGVCSGIENGPAFVRAFRARQPAVRFESIVSELVTACGQSALQLLEFFGLGSPTAAHRFVAECARRGLLEAHFTTNFDDLAERALTERGATYAPLFTSASFARRPPRDTTPVYYLHDTLPSRHRKQVECVATLDAVLSPLARHKRRVLEAALARHPVLFVGYSAIDLDIRPLLETYANRRSYWWVGAHEPRPGDPIHLLLRGDLSRFVCGTAEDCVSELAFKLWNVHLERATAAPQEGYIDEIARRAVAWSQRQRLTASAALLSLVGLTDRAIECLRSLAEIDPDAAARRLADLLYQAGRWRDLKRLVRAMVRRTRGRLMSPDTLSALARHAHNAELPAEAVKLATAAVRSVVHADSQTRARALLALGNVLTFRGSHVRALRALRSARALARKLPESRARIDNSIGVCLYRMGNWLRARRAYQRALAGFTESRHPFDLAKCHLNLAELLRREDVDLHAALEHIRIAENLAVKYEMNSVTKNLLPIRILTERAAGSEQGPDELREKLARAFADDSDPGETFANAVLDIGLIYMDQSRHALAIASFKDALAIYRKKKQPYRAAIAWANIAGAHAASLEVPRAKHALKRSRVLLRRQGKRRDRREVSAHIAVAAAQVARVSSTQGQFLRALRRANRLVRELGDSELMKDLQKVAIGMSGRGASRAHHESDPLTAASPRARPIRRS